MKTVVCIALLFFCALGGNAQDIKLVNFEAEIANRTVDTIKILHGKTQKEVSKIVVNNKGLFKDAFAVEEGMYYLNNGKEYTQLFLKNGYDLKLKLDAQKFSESIVYSGIGGAENNFMAQKAMADSKLDFNKLMSSTEDDFAKAIKERKTSIISKLEGEKLDSSFVSLQKKDIENSLNFLTRYYKTSLENKKLNGTASPSFNYDNYAGGKTKLEDFKGKYVYMDIWATWCGPCIAEIPSLKKIEKKYHGKNIAFVSISIDVQKDFEKWKTFVAKNELGDVQLIADKDWSSQFIKHYNILGIPRFILVDPNGNIVSADAERPSNPALQERLDSLLK